MRTLQADRLVQWLSGYKHSWEKQDADTFVTLFTDDAVYIDRPFSNPVAATSFHQFWSNLAKRQAEMHIEFEVLGICGLRAFVRFWGKYLRVHTGEHRVGEGIFVLDFDEAGRCRKFREYQHWNTCDTKAQEPVHARC